MNRWRLGVLALALLMVAGCRARVQLQISLDPLTLPLTGVSAPGGSVVFYLERHVDLKQARDLTVEAISWDYVARSTANLTVTLLVSDTGSTRGTELYARCTGAATGACEVLRALGYREAPAYLDQAAVFLQDQISGEVERQGVPASPQAAPVLQRCIEQGEMWVIVKVELPLPQFASFEGQVVLEQVRMHLEGTADFGGLAQALWPLL